MTLCPQGVQKKIKNLNEFPGWRDAGFHTFLHQNLKRGFGTFKSCEYAASTGLALPLFYFSKDNLIQFKIFESKQLTFKGKEHTIFCHLTKIPALCKKIEPPPRLCLNLMFYKAWVAVWPIGWCIPAVTAATQRCPGGSGCGRRRSGSPWRASWWFCRWRTGTPPRPSWFCAACSTVRPCRSHSSAVCRPGCWCSSCRGGGPPPRSAPSSGTCRLSAGEDDGKNE